MVAYNTNYYRRNKEKRFKVHKCPHCSFETTGPKSSLQAHIWAKHTEEKDRPFQCPCDSCNRGYSARANLHKHLKHSHNITIPKDKKVFAYSIHINNNICPRVTENQKKRLDFYKTNPVIPRNIKNMNDITCLEKMHFDVSQKLINIHPYTKQQVLDVYTLEQKKKK